MCLLAVQSPQMLALRPKFVLSTVKAEHWSSLGQNALAGGLLWTSGHALQEEACMGRAWWQAMWTLRRVEARLMSGS